MEDVKIRYHEEPEGWWAESDALPGWTAVGKTLSEVRAEARSALVTFLGEDLDFEEEGLPSGGGVRKPSG